MTKAQEMALFDEFAAKFGRDSYLGPWLQSIRADVDRSIRCDLYPMPDLPDEAYRKGEAARVRAMEAADAILADANQKAAAITLKGAQDVERHRAQARRWLEKAIGEI